MQWKKLIYALIICQLAGIIGAVFTSNSVKTWYTSIIKPSFNPPSWLFGPVWTTLFLMMGIALYLILLKKGPTKWFYTQLALNTLWSIIFFGMKNPTLAFIEIIILWIAILMTIITFYKKSKAAAYLLIPYILWVSFAAILNLAIAILN